MGEFICRDLFLKLTDKRHNITVRRHRVWDLELFLQSQMAQAVKDGGHVEIATEEQYEEYAKPARAR